jgi:hypothetical protein
MLWRIKDSIRAGNRRSIYRLFSPFPGQYTKRGMPFPALEVNQSRYRPGVAQRVPGS